MVNCDGPDKFLAHIGSVTRSEIRALELRDVDELYCRIVGAPTINRINHSNIHKPILNHNSV